MKKYSLLFASAFLVSAISSQSCIVSIDSLKGQYTGGCKHGKADGFGSAIGTDTYTGNFKNGYPDGQGKYIWKNGTWYDGNWKAGLFDGNGTFNKVLQANSDSFILITGFWQAGNYIGKIQKPYSVTSLTNGISEASARKLKDVRNEITIGVTSTTAGGSSLNIPALPKPKLVNIELFEGRYMQRADNETSRTINRYTLRNVTFPFYAILTFETTGTNTMPSAVEKIKVEITESSSWYIQVKIDN